jgi:predicted ester cyclase
MKQTEMKQAALSFFEACEGGKGWQQCSQYCHPDATFSAQAHALEGVTTLQGYTNWMRDLYSVMPDAHYEIKSFAVDEERNNVAGFGVFMGTHTGEGGPVPPTGKQVSAEYVYVMDFEGGRIRHMTKIWNDAISMQQLGWG